MKKTSRDFLNLFFNEGETISVHHDKFGYHSVEQESLEGDITLVSPSEKVDDQIIKEEDINLMAINPINGFRSDKNVTAFRSFLIELDDGSLKEQREYVESMGMPYSVCVFSGNKSLHYGIVLDSDLVSNDYWRKVNKWILNIMSKADQQTLNASRSIRFPENMRHNGKQMKQALLEMKGRVSKEDLNIWLNKFPDCKPKPKKDPYENFDPDTIADETEVPIWLIKKLKDGVNFERNATWFKYSCYLTKRGFTLPQIYKIFSPYYIPENDFTETEWSATVKNAHMKVLND